MHIASKYCTATHLFLSGGCIVALLSLGLLPIIAIGQTKMITPTDFNKPIGYSFEVLEGGAISITVGTETFIVDSLFGEVLKSSKTTRLVYHSFGTTIMPDDWSVSVTKHDSKTTVVTASTPVYRVTRTIKRKPSHISVSDTIQLTTKDLTPIPFKNRILLDGKAIQELKLGEKTSDSPAGACSSANTGNPSIYVQTQGARLGLIPQDDVYRVHVSMKNYTLPTLGNCPVGTPATVEMNDEFFGLDNERGYTLSWSIYPMPGSFTYWDFMNQARYDLGNIFTVEGTTLKLSKNDLDVPWEEMDAEELGDLLRHQGAKYVIVPPMDMTGERIDRDGILTPRHSLGTAFLEDFTQESDRLLRNLIEKVHKADPTIKVLMFLNPSASTGINDLQRFAGEAVIGSDGQPATLVAQPYTHYFIGTDTNKFGKIQIMQIDKVFKDYGADGVYYDQSAGAPSPRYNYNGSWDNYSLQIHPQTGVVSKKIASNQLLMQPRLIKMINYIRRQGGAIVMNNPPYTKTLADKHVQQFTETGNYQNIWTSLLTQPIAYAKNKPKPDPNPTFDFGEDPMKNIVMNVRHGVMTYLSSTPFASDIQNPPSAQLFPMTLLESHPGYLIGKERIVTAVSGTFSWNTMEPLEVFMYDKHGNQISKEKKYKIGSTPTRAEVLVPPGGLAIIIRGTPPASCTLELSPDTDPSKVKLSWSVADAHSLSISDTEPLSFELGDYSGVELVATTARFRGIAYGPGGLQSCAIRVYDLGKTFKLFPGANPIIDRNGHLSITLNGINHIKQVASITLRHMECRNLNCTTLLTKKHETKISLNELVEYLDYNIKFMAISTTSASFKVRRAPATHLTPPQHSQNIRER